MSVTCIITTPKLYIYIIYQQTLAPLHAITTIATGYHTPGSAPTYSPLSILNQDLKPPELSYSLLPFFGDFNNLFKDRISKEKLTATFYNYYKLYFN